MVVVAELEGRMRPEEIDYFSWMLASLTVSAARAMSVEQVDAIRGELEEMFRDVLARLDRPYLAVPCRTV